MGDFAADYRDATGTDAPASLTPQLKAFWDRPVSELATLHEPGPGPEEQERHRIYALMLMAMVHEYWNGNKRGRRGSYPHNEPDHSTGRYLDDDYKGHNIGAVAVNAEGRVLAFDFNHNMLFNSSAEHAEARLVRGIFSMAQLSDTWRVPGAGQSLPHVALNDSSTLADVTIYTSLESCAQCAGVMALARVKAIVYMQTDPGMYFVGRILRNLTDDKLRAPLPITGSEIGLPYLTELDSAADTFATQVAEKPFWTDDAAEPTVDGSGSVTSFLCTKAARDIYGRARAEFDALVGDPRTLQFPDFRPAESACTNSEAVAEAADFLGYATICGRRGTPRR